MTECDLCKTKSPRHNFNGACCRARFLATLPSREIRKEWLALWRRQVSTEMIEDIKVRLKARALRASE